MTTTTISCNTAESILSAEERCTLHRTWRELYATRKATSQDFLLYALLRGKDPKAGFTAISNTRKLTNGQAAWEGYRAAIANLDNASMDGSRLSLKLAVLFPGLSSDRHTALSRAIGQATTQLRKEA